MFPGFDLRLVEPVSSWQCWCLEQDYVSKEFEFWGAETSAGGAGGGCEAERCLPLGALFSAV